MENQNIDPYYNNIQCTDAFMNIFNNNVYPNHQSIQNDPIDIGSSEALSFWDFPHDPNSQYAPSIPFENNGETSNQFGTNLGNQIQDPVLLPLPSYGTGDIDNILVDPVPVPENSNRGMNNQNEIQEPFSFPCVVPPFTEQTGDVIVEYNGEINNRRETNSEQSLQVQFGCQCCEILREIVHIGRLVLKLQIHGRLVGVIFHAILDVEQSSEAVPREMFDFYQKSYEEVKQFLTQYCVKRKEEGYIMMTDPKSGFFEALCVGFDWYEKQGNEAHPEDIQIDEAANGGNNRGWAPLVTEAANNNYKDKNLVSLTVQRKRVKEMTVKDLASYLHLPRKEAAQKLGLSETVVHNIWCKGNGNANRRWPHRKIQGKRKEIMKLEAEIADSNTPQHVRDRAAILLRRRHEELDKFYNEDG